MLKESALKEARSTIEARDMKCNELRNSSDQARTVAKNKQNGFNKKLQDLRAQTQRISQEHGEDRKAAIAEHARLKAEAAQLNGQITQLTEETLRLREVLLPSYAATINKFEMAFDERVKIVRATLRLETPQEEPPDRDCEALLSEEQEQLQTLVAKKDAGDAALQELQTRADSQIKQLFEDLENYAAALRDAVDKIKEYKGKVATFVAQNERRWDITTEDTLSIIQYFTARLQNQPATFPVLQAPTHESFTTPMPVL
jgi:chromosome segregation ATPase